MQQRALAEEVTWAKHRPGGGWAEGFKPLMRSQVAAEQGQGGDEGK